MYLLISYPIILSNTKALTVVALRFLLDALVGLGIVLVPTALVAAVLLRLPLDLLHLGSLVLEPHLHHSHRQSRVFGERFPNLRDTNDKY